MTHWDYRVISTRTQDEPFLQIHEVYYEGDDIILISENGCRPGGDDIKELVEDLKAMRDALAKPVLYRHELEKMFKERAKDE